MRVLVAVDGSEEADRALDYALRIVDAADGALTAVHVVAPEVQVEGGTEEMTGLSDAERRLFLESVEDTEERGARVLQEAATRAERRGQDVETVLLYGDPVVQVTDYAAGEEVVDGIVVGHRGRSERADDMLGSVARGVVERAAVPVTVVR
jgi:nucleotide-binding universal stress UspA family protein